MTTVFPILAAGALSVSNIYLSISSYFLRLFLISQFSRNGILYSSIPSVSIVMLVE